MRPENTTNKRQRCAARNSAAKLSCQSLGLLSPPQPGGVSPNATVPLDVQQRALRPPCKDAVSAPLLANEPLGILNDRGEAVVSHGGQRRAESCKGASGGKRQEGAPSHLFVDLEALFT